MLIYLPLPLLWPSCAQRVVCCVGKTGLRRSQRWRGPAAPGNWGSASQVRPLPAPRSPSRRARAAMLLEHLPLLRDKRVVLASASPRRKELLVLLGLRFEVRASSFDEDLPHSNFRSAGDYAAETATHKAIDVARQTDPGGSGQLADIVIGSDTVVEFEGEILEKPADAEDAFRVLSRLSGRTNRVHTGVVIVLPNVPDPKLGTPPFIRSFSETTEVEFAPLSPGLIRAYIDTGEPFGKAGSYGIQGTAGSFVRGLKGDYFNVMGFPIHRFSTEMVDLIQQGLIK
mmetsp:Transcript_27835/g.69982  ORF Transcript_27835/g.69982 Transcript_27835/m.69982 type:complete len:285 (+) Transcript_27835:58-912(+)